MFLKFHIIKLQIFKQLSYLIIDNIFLKKYRGDFLILQW